jgi:hypothetical protein
VKLVIRRSKRSNMRLAAIERRLVVQAEAIASLERELATVKADMACLTLTTLTPEFQL